MSIGFDCIDIWLRILSTSAKLSVDMKFNKEETTEKFIHVLCIFGKIFSRHSLILRSELVGVMKHYLIEPISSLTYVKGDLGYTSLNTITVEEEIELRFHSRFLIGVALMISYL
ncbi:hypothetical protein T09_7197 [Trichinella sp. T9]|nr:hypothetical protein T09_7197 [Trichinella sp. T9]